MTSTQYFCDHEADNTRCAISYYSLYLFYLLLFKVYFDKCILNNNHYY